MSLKADRARLAAIAAAMILPSAMAAAQERGGHALRVYSGNSCGTREAGDRRDVRMILAELRAIEYPAGAPLDAVSVASFILSMGPDGKDAPAAEMGLAQPGAGGGAGAGADGSQGSAKPRGDEKPTGGVPSLDELLGITPKEGEGENKGPDASRQELDRLLSAEEIGDAFKQAVVLMGDAAKRLEESKDTGLGTQRVQEDVVRRLDQLLASLEKNQSSQSQSSQSQSDQQSQKTQPNQSKQRQQQKGQQAQQGDGMTDWDGPPKQEGPLRPGLDSARAAWGSLPARVRDMLLQGSSDRFSSKYDEMTRAYYKRLAEEKK